MPFDSRSTLWISVWGLLLPLVLGLDRFLVVCHGPHCDARVEVVHASGSCCGHEHEYEHEHDAAPGSTSGDLEIAGCHGECVDTALLIGTAPVPRSSHDLPTPPAVATEIARAFDEGVDAVGSLRPPGTGPPRISLRNLLVTTTVLLL